MPHALLFPSVLVCSWVLPSHASLTLPTLPRCLVLQLTFRPLLLQLHSTPSPQLLSMFWSTAPSPSHKAAGKHKLVVSGSSTHCPCQLKTGPASSVHIHMSIVYTPLFTSSLVVVPSRILRMWGFLSSSTTTFPARTTFCIEMRGLTTLALLNVLHL